MNRVFGFILLEWTEQFILSFFDFFSTESHPVFKIDKFGFKLRYLYLNSLKKLQSKYVNKYKIYKEHG